MIRPDQITECVICWALVAYDKVHKHFEWHDRLNRRIFIIKKKHGFLDSDYEQLALSRNQEDDEFEAAMRARVRDRWEDNMIDVEAWLANPNPADFPELEHIAKQRDDPELMRRIVNACLDRLGAADPMHARILVCGLTWYLRKAGNLDAAAQVAADGIDLAQQVKAHRTVAYGIKVLGRIRNEQSRALFDEAAALFMGLGDQDEAAECEKLADQIVGDT